MNKFVLKELFGEKAIYGIGKLFLRPKNKVEIGSEILNSTLIAGVIVTDEDLCPNKNNDVYGYERMVECEVIIIPKRIYEDRKDYFSNYRIDQVLTRGYADNSNYIEVKE